MNILMISPGYPSQMPAFAEALAATGARVFGIGDQPESSLPDRARRAVTAHLQVRDLWDEGSVIGRVMDEMRKNGVRFHRIECLWEPGMGLAARLREALGVPGLGYSATEGFRDKEVMKRRLDAAGLRTPRHAVARTKDEIRRFAGPIGFPLIVKPIAGAGATDTYRINSKEELESVLPRLGHVESVSVEEFIEGDEFTFDTICAGGRILFENVAWYRTKPIEERKHQWVSPSCICLRDLDVPELAGGRKLGRQVLDALGFRDGFTHMEWFRKADGEVVFGEIAARPAGANLVDAMNFASEVDLFRGWAEAVTHGRWTQPFERKYNAAVVGKRAAGNGRIRAIRGLEKTLRELGPAIAAVRMPAIGAPAGNWRRGSPSDGFVFVRHPDFETCVELADRVARDIEILAG
ncbi:hypothetical protein ABI59_12760 [Acidobacteria bacterium Mor1]|nr:hypothetical protein ABI59_12760 [Acidobacteria bacterium Mor1]